MPTADEQKCLGNADVADHTIAHCQGNLSRSAVLLQTRKNASAMRAWLKENNPSAAAVMIDERDAYMTTQLRALTGKVPFVL